MLPTCDNWPRVHHVHTVYEPTFRGLSSLASTCLYSFGTKLQSIVDPGCGLFILFQNLHPGNCQHRVHPVYTVSNPICIRLLAWVAACFIGFLNLHTRDCQPGLQPVYMVFDPTYQGQSDWDAVGLYGFSYYIQGTVSC